MQEPITDPRRIEAQLTVKLGKRQHSDTWTQILFKRKKSTAPELLDDITWAEASEAVYGSPWEQHAMRFLTEATVHNSVLSVSYKTYLPSIDGDDGPIDQKFVDMFDYFVNSYEGKKHEYSPEDEEDYEETNDPAILAWREMRRGYHVSDFDFLFSDFEKRCEKVASLGDKHLPGMLTFLSVLKAHSAWFYENHAGTFGVFGRFINIASRRWPKLWEKAQAKHKEAKSMEQIIIIP